MDIQPMFSTKISFGFSLNTFKREYIYTMNISRNIYFILKRAKNMKLRIFQQYKSQK